MQNMKLWIDTNILLDVLQKREPFYHDSAKVWKMCEARMVEGHVSVLSFMNLVYILRRELSAEQIEKVYKALTMIFVFEDLCHVDVSAAVGLKMQDFEDATQMATAKRIGADCIITRNVKDYGETDMVVSTPEDFVRDFCAAN